MKTVVCMRVEDDRDPVKGTVKLVCHTCKQPINVAPTSFQIPVLEGGSIEDLDLVCTVCFLEMAKISGVGQIAVEIRAVQIAELRKHLEKN